MNIMQNKQNDVIDKKLIEAEKAEEQGMKWYTQEEYEDYFAKVEKDKCIA